MEYDRNTDTTWQEGFQKSFHSNAGSFDQHRQKIFDEYPRWHARLRNSRLAVRVERLWRMLFDGKLSPKDTAIVIGALLYCIAPFDLTPDFIPVAGFLDDLVVVISVLAYLDRSQEKESTDGKHDHRPTP